MHTTKQTRDLMKRKRDIASLFLTATLVTTGSMGLASPADRAARRPAPSSFSASSERTAQGLNGWSSNGPGSKIRCLAIAPGDPNTVYAGSERGAFKSSDGGATWSSAGLKQTAVSALAIDPSDPNTVYTIADGAVFR